MRSAKTKPGLSPRGPASCSSLSMKAISNRGVFLERSRNHPDSRRASIYARAGTHQWVVEASGAGGAASAGAESDGAPQAGSAGAPQPHSAGAPQPQSAGAPQPQPPRLRRRPNSLNLRPLEQPQLGSGAQQLGSAAHDGSTGSAQHDGSTSAAQPQLASSAAQPQPPWPPNSLKRALASPCMTTIAPTRATIPTAAFNAKLLLITNPPIKNKHQILLKTDHGLPGRQRCHQKR